MIGRRPHVALVPDVPGWAYDNIADQIRRRLAGRYDFTILYETDHLDAPGTLLRELCSGRYDLAHVFSRTAVCDWLRPPMVAALRRVTGWSLVDIAERLVATRLTTSIYSHIRLDPHSIRQDTAMFAAGMHAYTVPSAKLDAIYRGIASYRAPDAVIRDGVDLELFRPRDLARLSDPRRTLVVGWAGNSEWGYQRDGRDHKGLASIIRPVVAALQRRGLPVRGVFHDRNDDWVPYPAMVDYFNGIDIYVCASDTEGTATPVLEAMACGLPIVSTDVGIVPEALGPRQAEFIVRERSRAAITDALCRLIEEPDTRRALSAENLARVQAWDWCARVEGWDEFFTAALARRDAPERLASRRDVLTEALYRRPGPGPVWRVLAPLRQGARSVLQRGRRGRRLIGWLNRWRVATGGWRRVQYR